MTHAEKRLLLDTARRLEDLERKYDSMCEVFGILVNRRAGRPTKTEIAQLEEAQARMNGANH